MHTSQDDAVPGHAAAPGHVTVPGLSGAVVIVTGAGSGIGAATTRRLGAAGAPVVLVGRREDPLRAVAAEITAAGGRPCACPPTWPTRPARAGSRRPA